MNFLMYLLFIFLISKSTFAFNSENLLNQNNLISHFDNLPLEIQEYILVHQTSSYKNIPYVNKKWNKIIFSNLFYKTEKSFSFFIKNLKIAFDHKDFTEMNSEMDSLIQALEDFEKNSEILVQTNEEDVTFRTYSLSHLNLELKNEIFSKKIQPGVTSFIDNVLDEIIQYGSSRFKVSKDKKIYTFLEQLLKINLISQEQLQKIFNWVSSDFNEEQNKRNTYRYGKLFRKILIHPHCTNKLIQELIEKVLTPNTNLNFKIDIYKGLSFQKTTNIETLTHIINDENFWSIFDYEHSSNEYNYHHEKNSLDIIVNLFSHPFLADENLNQQLWNQITEKMKNFMKKGENVQLSTDSSFKKIVTKLFSSPQISSKDKISDIFSYISYFEPQDKLKLLSVLLKNKKLDPDLLKNEVYPFLENLFLTKEILNNNNNIIISKVLMDITHQPFMLSLISQRVQNLESFESKFSFLEYIAGLLNQKNLNNTSFDLINDLFNKIRPTFLYLSDREQYLFLKIFYHFSNSISQNELIRFLYNPNFSAEYVFLLSIITNKISSNISFENQHRLWNTIKKSVQIFPDNIKKPMYIDLAKQFFEKFPKSVFFNELLKEIDTWDNNSDFKNYGIFIISNLKFTHLGYHPLFDQLLKNIPIENIKSIILNRLKNKLKFTDNEIYKEISLMLSNKIYQEIFEFYKKDYYPQI